MVATTQQHVSGFMVAFRWFRTHNDNNSGGLCTGLEQYLECRVCRSAAAIVSSSALNVPWECSPLSSSSSLDATRFFVSLFAVTVQSSSSLPFITENIEQQLLLEIKHAVEAVVVGPVGGDGGGK